MTVKGTVTAITNLECRDELFLENAWSPQQREPCETSGMPKSHAFSRHDPQSLLLQIKAEKWQLTWNMTISQNLMTLGKIMPRDCVTAQFSPSLTIHAFFCILLCYVNLFLLFAAFIFMFHSIWWQWYVSLFELWWISWRSSFKSAYHRALIKRWGGGGGAGIFPGYFLRKIEEKIEEKEIPGCFIPRLLVEHIFTRQLKTLVTSLAYHIRKMQTICYWFDGMIFICMEMQLIDGFLILTNVFLNHFRFKNFSKIM